MIILIIYHIGVIHIRIYNDKRYTYLYKKQSTPSIYKFEIIYYTLYK